MNGEVFLCNQSSRQGSVQMLFVVPKQIRHAAISLQDFSLFGCRACTCSCSLFLSDHGDLQQSYGMKNKVGWFLCIFIRLSRHAVLPHVHQWNHILSHTSGQLALARVGP